MGGQTTRVRILSYLKPTTKRQLDKDRERIGELEGRALTVSAYVDRVLTKHLNRLTAA